ncbi:MAG: hypothetical protein WBV55_13745, partial [Candidatus Sulfotelmatobacter sp.]
PSAQPRNCPVILSHAVKPSNQSLKNSRYQRYLGPFPTAGYLMVTVPAPQTDALKIEHAKLHPRSRKYG